MASRDQEPATDVADTPQIGPGNGHQAGQHQRPPAPADAQPGPGALPSGLAAPRKGPNPLVLVIVAIVLIAAVVWGLKFYAYSQTHVDTDDAYVTGDLINVSPIISGTLAKLNVDEGDVVRAGEVVAQLDDSGPRASYDQALAAAEAAQSQVPQAQTNLQYQQASVNAQIAQAEAGLSAQDARINAEKTRTILTRRTVNQTIIQAEAQGKASQAQVLTALQQLQSALKAVQTEQAAAAAAHSQVASYRANAEKAHKDAVRYADLYGTNGSVAAVTAQQNDAAQAADQSAAAQLQAATDSAAQADSAVQQAEAQVQVSRATVDAARAQAQAAEAQVGVARANSFSVPVQQGSVANNQFLGSQQAAALQAAKAMQQQVTLRGQQLVTARSQAQQASAALAAAKVTLDDTIIAAPCNGTVVKKAVNPGDALSPGQTIVTMTRSGHVWVEANYKETQLEGIKPGESAEVTVDAFPHKVFKGRVLSIDQASGNTISLFPADNATGNFTKVVMRIPVRIELIPSPEGNADNYATARDIANLRQGMSVDAVIDLR